MVSFTIVSRKAEPLKNIVENLQSKLQQKTGNGTSEADPLQLIGYAPKHHVKFLVMYQETTVTIDSKASWHIIPPNKQFMPFTR